MRSIRNAAVAGVTALAVSLSGVTAFAAEPPAKSETNTASENTNTTKPAENTGKDGNPAKQETKGSLSSQLSPKYDGDEAVTGQDAFGSVKLPDSELPKWLTAWKGFTIAGIVLTILTNLIAPAYNYLKFNGII
ncbi:hypothetical protein HMPREF1219_02502 [Corynebacterium pyruviciproducens ATCC BAA-1742]|uniref:Or membrane protein n=1 Tax=Corynebacterium pyruviciproducens ATCC BAA-1742 TaxID=1125779 RepID=S2YUL9_9CORY|nr:hypothetical protein [Corynebacterium pyruviciproducens]EPD68078.1 hypothetical protein HMPREF1219_02502 [Corynebacterium pyruviciproducens ATCC BAA-1742]